MSDQSNLPAGMRARGLREVGIAPVEIREERWLCLGFEEAGVDRGDFMHLALLRTPDLQLREGVDLYDAALTTFRGQRDVCLRIHSECLLGDALGSSLCDCGEQLRMSLSLMGRSERSLLIYLRQEGRGLGMRAKLDVLARQRGVLAGRKVAPPLSPDMANVAAGYRVDERDYGAAGKLLSALGVASVRLVTGNLEKIRAVRRSGVEIEEMVDAWSSKISATAWRELRQKEGRDYRYARFSAEPWLEQEN